MTQQQKESRIETIEWEINATIEFIKKIAEASDTPVGTIVIGSGVGVIQTQKRKNLSSLLVETSQNLVGLYEQLDNLRGLAVAVGDVPEKN